MKTLRLDAIDFTMLILMKKMRYVNINIDRYDNLLIRNFHQPDTDDSDSESDSQSESGTFSSNEYDSSNESLNSDRSDSIHSNDSRDLAWQLTEEGRMNGHSRRNRRDSMSLVSYIYCYYGLIY